MTVRAKTSGSAHEIRDRELDRVSRPRPIRRRDCVDRKKGRKGLLQGGASVEYHHLARSGYKKGNTVNQRKLEISWKRIGRCSKSTEGREEEVRRRSFGREDRSRGVGHTAVTRARARRYVIRFASRAPKIAIGTKFSLDLSPLWERTRYERHPSHGGLHSKYNRYERRRNQASIQSSEPTDYYSP